MRAQTSSVLHKSVTIQNTKLHTFSQETVKLKRAILILPMTQFTNVSNAKGNSMEPEILTFSTVASIVVTNAASIVTPFLNCAPKCAREVGFGPIS